MAWWNTTQYSATACCESRTEKAIAGNVSIEMLLDGTANPCVTVFVTLVAEAYTTIHIETDIQFDQVCRCQNNTSHQISFAIVSNGGAGNIVNVCSGVSKR